MINYLKQKDVDFFIEQGILLELNRVVLHPLGLALELEIDKENLDKEITLKVWDYREDPAGNQFGIPYEDLKSKINAFEKLFAERAATRKEKLGYVVQYEDKY